MILSQSGLMLLFILIPMLILILILPLIPILLGGVMCISGSCAMMWRALKVVSIRRACHWGLIRLIRRLLAVWRWGGFICCVAARDMTGR
jgi:hypothetical protein